MAPLDIVVKPTLPVVRDFPFCLFQAFREGSRKSNRVKVCTVLTAHKWGP